MKAIVCTKYGAPDVLELQEVEKPTPRDNQVLVQVQAASVNALDWHLMRAEPFLVRLMGKGFLKPQDPRMGVDLAGRVEAVGSAVTQFRPGDEVFGGGSGAFAEYACASENALALKPANLSFEEAAAVPVAALTALQGLRDKGRVQTGQKVLIHGASGGVGTFAVQIAKSFGAQVTAVCSTRNVDMVRSLGADHVVDYKKEDFTRNGERYDLILAVNGYHSIFTYQRALSAQGVYVMAGGANERLFQAMFQTMLLGPLIVRTGKQTMGTFMAEVNQQDLAFMKELLESGKVVPVIDGCYPLEKTAEALRYFEQVHAKGKVVITLEHNKRT